MSVAFESYEPQEDSKSRFVAQLQVSDRVAKRLKNQINDLEETLRADSESFPKDSDIFHKCEHLRAFSSIYIAVKRMLRLRDVAMDPKYEQAPDESAEKRHLAENYDRMTEILRLFKDRFDKLLEAPDSWFSVQAIRLKTWLEDNPKAAAAIAVGCSAVSGAGLGIYASTQGHCLIYYLCTGGACSCSSWGVGASVAIGSGLGLVLGAGIVLLVGLSLRYYNYYYTSDRSKEEVKAINAMVSKMESMSHEEVRKALDELFETCQLALPADILDSDDRKCLICLSEQGEVRTPVKAPRCRGRHFMCKACWIQTLSVHGDKCPVCRV
mmetsp:Transcript_8571/g.25956  ORF Transcript_8571/g.25956 Transcript_8571/m.25956 type:complete len:325 (-) Transcript_8571:264-1238(-)